MKRNEFISHCAMSLLGAHCRRDNTATEDRRQLLLEADLGTELLQPGQYKINPTVGIFVRRITSGSAPRDFECIWMICTHARCTTAYKPAEEQFACPCHGSLFGRDGKVLQGPAADPLERHKVEINGRWLRVYS